jgi:hypothetical protein
LIHTQLRKLSQVSIQLVASQCLPSRHAGEVDDAASGAHEATRGRHGEGLLHLHLIERVMIFMVKSLGKWSFHGDIPGKMMDNGDVMGSKIRFHQAKW